MSRLREVDPEESANGVPQLPALAERQRSAEHLVDLLRVVDEPDLTPLGRSDGIFAATREEVGEVHGVFFFLHIPRLTRRRVRTMSFGPTTRSSS